MLYRQSSYADYDLKSEQFQTNDSLVHGDVLQQLCTGCVNGELEALLLQLGEGHPWDLGRGGNNDLTDLMMKEAVFLVAGEIDVAKTCALSL